MQKKGFRPLLIACTLLWTAGVLYGSLAPGDDLPTGWWAAIPYFDKIVHFIFYAGEASLLLLWFEPRGWRKGWVVGAVIAASAGIEWIQGEYINRANEPIDLIANTLGAFSGLGIAPLLRRWIVTPLFGADSRETSR